MMKIRKIFSSLIVTCLFFVASSFCAKAALAAPRLYLDPASESAPIGQDFQVNLNIDVGTTQVFGADALITFPNSDVTIKSVTKGDFFTDLGFGQAGTQVEIHGYFSTAYQSKSGTGTIATIILTSNRAAGSGLLHFSCDGFGTDTTIVDVNGNNILACSSLNQSVINFSTGDTISPTASPESVTSPNGTSSNGSTNSCGGTCGSHYNCNSGLFCNNGYCRNPDCPTSTTCGCVVTPKPTVKATARPKPNVKATPQVVTLTKFTPIPSSTPIQSPPPQIEAPESQKTDYTRVGIWVAGSLFALFLLFVILKFFKGKNNPPKITPPTTGGSTESFQTYQVNPPIQSPQEPPPFPSVP